MRFSSSLLVALPSVALAALSTPTTVIDDAFVRQRNANEPYATFSTEALEEYQMGGCYKAPSPPELRASAAKAPFSFSESELAQARANVDIDWRKHGAVNPVQQQHPFGTCWAFSMIAVTEAVSVIQGKKPLTKLAEQMVVSCVPPSADGDNSDTLWSWAYHHTKGRYQTEEVYPYNRTCNFFRERLLAPDGTRDGYPFAKCDLPNDPPFGPCPPCPGIERKDGTPECMLDESKGFSEASVQGWGFVGPHGVSSEGRNATPVTDPSDVTRMVAALQKYGPAQIGIDASCLAGYKSGIISNCTRRSVDHAVAIVGAGTDDVSGIDYWIVRNSWNYTFGEQGYFRVQRDTNQMGIFGGYYACFHEDCMIDPPIVPQ
jgi:cathepsin L